jgi:FAD dependent oxidoreductase TIGR03364
VPALAAHLAARHGVEVRTGTAVLARTRAGLATSRGPVAAARVVVCPGTDFATLYPETIASLALRKCRLSMLRLADPGVRLGAPLMSDLGLIRYRGYAALPEAEALRARLGAEHPRALANGVHLIVVQGEDGSLVVGDSHHTSALPDPFAPAEAEAEILAELARASGLPPPPALERWTGVYAVSEARTYVVAAPEPDVRLAIVTSGTGASTAFAIAEAVLLDLCGLPLGEIP